MVVDYVFLLMGGALSLYLLHIGRLTAEPTPSRSSPALRELVEFLPEVMRLPEGILLMWPAFYLAQLVRRRAEGLTGVEWLWFISWLGVAVLTGLAVWQHSGTLPESLSRYAVMPRKLWYLIFVPSLGLLALVLGILGSLHRGSAPWTHTFGLVLLAWPIAPLLAILSLGEFR
jgi:hypothetical protein